MTIRILLFSLLPLLSFAQYNSKVTISTNKQTSEKGPLEPKRNTIFNLDEIKIRWKKAALENCPWVVCPTASVPGPCTTILATPTGPSSASVSFVPPTNDGGSPITGYVVTATPTSSAPAKRKSSSVIIVTGTSSPILLTGLSFGTNYIFSVLATNAVGGSPPITTTTTVTPCILNTALAASTNPTLDVNTVITPSITIATTGATGIGTATGLPAGVTASWSTNLITISGTPTATGTFNYMIPLTGGCGSVDATGTITVNAASLATLTTTAVSVVTDIGASSGGNITADGGAAITAKGVVWSTSTLPTVSLSTKTTDGTGTGIFTSTISGLTASTKYYVRSYATNTSGTSYGSELDFTTCTLNTAAASTNQTLVVNTALTNIMIATMGATGISNAGVSGSNSLPAGVSATWANNTITISGTPTATGTFIYSIPLTGGCGSVNATGTIIVNAASLATLTTTGVSVVTDIGASSGGNITADGGAAITAKGVVWSTSTLPTVSLSTKTTDGTGTGIFTSTISGLTASTKYYVRSYATNTSGTSYGSELDFTTCTLNTAVASTNQTLVVNTALTNIMIATMGATGISNAGVSGSNSLPAGVSATFANNTITISGTPTATGTFIYSIPLTGGCGSVNATGTIIVNAVSLATLTTTAVSVVTDIGASSGGNITADGGAAITAKGVVWSTSTLPTVSLSTKTTDGTGTGIFTSTISGLTASTKYYVRSYATNTSGTSYGSELDFTTCTLNTAAASTNQTLVVNTALTNIMIATMGATDISNAGVSGSNSLPAGVSATWAVNIITISGTPTATGTFIYSIPLTGGCGSVNATGTITVIPAACPNGKDTIRDIDNNSYNIVAIGTQCWTKENLRVRKYNDGTSILFNNTGGVLGSGNPKTWEALTVGAHTIYAHDSTTNNPSNLTKYGYLYNWYAAKGIASFNSTTYKNICPSGWHIPTKSDWNKLVKFIDSGADTTVTTGGTQSTTAGTELKKNDALWNVSIPASPGTNTSGFSGLPGGARIFPSNFGLIGSSAYFWSASELDSTSVWFLQMFNDNGVVNKTITDKRLGLSIRCLKD
jgi:uncharacterized protein (TIGR02145 family)